MRTITDGATIEAHPCLSSVKEEESKSKHRNRPDLKEKANCPDCGKELTVHGLKYTHKKYCKAKRHPPEGGQLEGPVPVLQPAPMPKLERTVTTEPMRVESKGPPATTPLSSSLAPTDEQIAAFLLNQKRNRANKRREQMSLLVSSALPK